MAMYLGSDKERQTHIYQFTDTEMNGVLHWAQTMCPNEGEEVMTLLMRWIRSTDWDWVTRLDETATQILERVS